MTAVVSKALSPEAQHATRRGRFCAMTPPSSVSALAPASSRPRVPYNSVFDRFDSRSTSTWRALRRSSTLRLTALRCCLADTVCQGSSACTPCTALSTNLDPLTHFTPRALKEGT